MVRDIIGCECGWLQRGLGKMLDEMSGATLNLQMYKGIMVSGRELIRITVGENRGKSRNK